MCKYKADSYTFTGDFRHNIAIPYLAMYMLRLSGLRLIQFKNYTAQHFIISEPIVAVTGANGTGKTNLLDAIYYCCCTKSYFAQADQTITQAGSDGFRLEADFTAAGIPMHFVCINRADAKKEIMMNDVPYHRIAEHVGKFPVVMIAPDDINMITGPGENRRKFIDQLLCQLHPAYLEALMKYNKILLQRNALLKSFAEKNVADDALLDILDDQICVVAGVVSEYRKKLMEDFPDAVRALYSAISNSRDDITVKYESTLLEADMKSILKRNRVLDKNAQRTRDGIHKDDLSFYLGTSTFKATASQGQKKSLLFALKLAAFNILRNHQHESPLLLLDDIFEKLDEARLTRLMEHVCAAGGQVFITDTHTDRIQNLFDGLGRDFQSIELQK